MELQHGDDVARRGSAEPTKKRNVGASLGFGLWGLGFGLWGLGLRISGLGD